MGPRHLAAITAASLCAALGSPGAAFAVPGPPLTEPQAALDASVRCLPGFDDAPRRAVLLVHGTFVDATFWDSSYARALPAAGYPTCTVNVPDGEQGDVQRSVQYVVHAIRAVAARAGTPIAVIGHSQGALLPTFALRYWPDLAGKVQDVVGLAGVYEHGTTVAPALCSVGCGPVARQISPGSRFNAAQARRPLYEGPDYTSVNTQFDELVQPQPQAGRLVGARAITVQDLCTGRLVEHGALGADNVGYRLALDAIEHDGPANPARIPRSACGSVFLPWTDLLGFSAQLVKIVPVLAGFTATRAQPELPLQCVFDPSCAKPKLTPGFTAKITPRTAPRRPYTFVARGSVELPAGAIDQCSGTVGLRFMRGKRTVARRTAQVGRDCDYQVVAKLGRTQKAARRVRGRLRVTIRFSGTGELTAVSRVLPRVTAR